MIFANLKNLCHLCGERSSGQKLTNWVSIPKNNVVFYHIYIECDNVHLSIFLMNYINTYAWLQNLFVNMFRLAVMCAHVGSIATVSNAQGNTEVTSAPFVNPDVHTHMSIYCDHLFCVMWV